MYSTFLSAELLSIEKLQNFKEKFGAAISPPHFYIRHPSHAHTKHRLSEIPEIKEKIIYPLVNTNPYPISVIIVEFPKEKDDTIFLQIYSGENTYAGAMLRKQKDGSYSDGEYVKAVDFGPS